MEPYDHLVSSMLTDFYQITMAYAYWKNGKALDLAVFDLYFRAPPFQGEYTVFCGLEEVLRFLNCYKFTKEQSSFLKQNLPDCEPEFFEFMESLDCSQVKVYAIKEGSVVFPMIPLLRVEGPLALTQLLETTLLALVNYASLVATNAARYRVAANASGRNGISLLEFGLRRSQGPDGGVSASRYTYIGGFNGTSNVLAGQLFGIPIKGTHAHSFVSSFIGLEGLEKSKLVNKSGELVEFLPIVLKYRGQVEGAMNTNESELAAFVAYALAFPKGFMALVDTYNTLKSGVVNFEVVALALNEIGYKAIGVRLDSGDMAYLSVKTRESFRAIAKLFHVPEFEFFKICASSDIDEEALYSLKTQGHEIDIFGIGTNLVTCKGNPALGCVYKLVSVNGNARIKLSNNIQKVTIPGKKEAYRLLGQEGSPLLDLLVECGEDPPKVGESVYCRHPFNESKRCYVKPSGIIKLHNLVWDGKIVDGVIQSLDKTQEFCKSEIDTLRPDHKYYSKPTPYKISLSAPLYDLFHKLWLKETPVEEIT